MQIKNVRVWSENLKLTKPYSISYETIDSVKNVFVHIELEDGIWGIGSGSPAAVSYTHLTLPTKA